MRFTSSCVSSMLARILPDLKGIHACSVFHPLRCLSVRSSSLHTFQPQLFTPHHALLHTLHAPASVEPPSLLPNHTRGYNKIRGRARKLQLPPHIEALIKKAYDETPHPVRPVIPTPSPSPYLPSTQRCGAIAIKVGMTHEWDEWGVHVPLTVLFMDDNQVCGYKYPERDGKWSLIVGAGHAKLKQVPLDYAKFYIEQGLPIKEFQAEFSVSEDGAMPVGTHIGAAHFVAGQRLSITGWTKWKGFQGVMRRWGFKGMPADKHGTSKTHRHPGSIGSRGDRKVLKGKKMAEFGGNERVTQSFCRLWKVDPARNLLYIKGSVSGPTGRAVMVRDSPNYGFFDREKWQVPVPTFLGAELPGVTQYVQQSDPYLPYKSDQASYFEVKWDK